MNAILAAFRSGARSIWLKRMGRTEDARWYGAVDFSEISVLVIEWTHGNSDFLQGVDIPVLLKRPEFQDAFTSFYILPSIFNTDLDRGFSLIDYGLSEILASPKALEDLKALGIDLALDFILNHASVLSKQFQDILKRGDDSPYRDFFIDWNRFWEGHGTMTQDGYIQPDAGLIRDMFFRKPGLPILMVRFPDGRDVPYWNTFYQEVRYDPVDAQDLMRAMPLQYGTADALAKCVNTALAAGKTPKQMDLGRWNAYKAQVADYLESRRKYLGQMDLNIRSPLVWDYYRDTLQTLAGYGAWVVRLDAFAYAPKEVGARNFLNDPGTWELLDKVQEIAAPPGVTLLPEIHASYAEKTYALLAGKGYMVYDFFLPGLLIDAFERKSGTYLKRWIDEITEKGIRTVNMLGCHDGIPLLDLKGLLDEDSIQRLIDTVVARGGYVKDLHGQKNVYYQVNATYYSALGEDDRRMLLARAVQLFMPGKPQVWYLDLFAGKNDYEAMRRAGAGGHKEINRTNLTAEEASARLERPVVARQLELLRMRNRFPVFCEAACVTAQAEAARFRVTWRAAGQKAVLDADLSRAAFAIVITEDAAGKELFRFAQE